MNLLRTLACALALAASLPAQTVLVKPYVQPSENTAPGNLDTKLLVWITDQRPGAFTVDYGLTAALGSTARVARVTLNISPQQQYYKYIATLPNLPLDAQVHYRVRLRSVPVRESSFATRKGPASPLRFVVVGDTADGLPESRKVAYQIARTKPEQMLIVGDLAYFNGSVSDYFSNFWGVYNNTSQAGPSNGAPLMQSVPVHALLGNHDVAAANLDFMPDGLGAFYFFHAPTNGPALPSGLVPIIAAPAKAAAFKAGAGAAHPALAYYSFDNGPAHFLCLDSEHTTNLLDRALHEWIERDLSNSRAPWKLVFFHRPGFHSAISHFGNQWMRILTPAFERHGVDVVFSGHVHNYQRSKPLKFAPANTEVWDHRGIMTGRFTLDEKFDGRLNTRPEGILYLVTGGGGAGLYTENITAYPEEWLRTLGWAPYTVKFIADRHSFSLVELDTRQLTLRQLDDEGVEVDRFQITKPK